MRPIFGKLNDELLINLHAHGVARTKSITAAVAYAQPSCPFFEACRRRNVHLTFYGLLDDDVAVSPKLLRDLLAWGPSLVRARLVNGHFHPKVIWWHGFGVYIGSANLTHAAWFLNVECGVFFEESELEDSVRDDLEDMFAHLEDRSVPLTSELVAKLEVLELRGRGALHDEREKQRRRFDDAFRDLPSNAGLTTIPTKGVRKNERLVRFVKEWSDTLELLRGLARDFARLDLRPAWVPGDAHPAIHFDQFLHAYYYEFIRGRLGEEDDEDRETSELIERAHDRARVDRAAALRDAAKWWASLESAPHGEADFIQSHAPTMRQHFSRAGLESMTKDRFRDAMEHVNAFRTRARQTKNTAIGLPEGWKESGLRRAARVSDWMWEARSEDGRTVRDVLNFVIWGDHPIEMERRLFSAFTDPEWRIEHLGKSTLGELVGWARPDDFPPRNDRTNKALRALGHDVRLF